MIIRLKDRSVWLSRKNKIKLEIENSRSGSIGLENGEGYRVIGPAERSISTSTRRVSFEVEFDRVGEVTLRVGHRAGLHPYRVESLNVEVISPFCHERGVSPYIFKRPKVKERLNKSVESMRSGMIWMWGLPQVGKTMAIREWRESHPRSVYISLADWREDETLCNLVFRLVRDQLPDDCHSDEYAPSSGRSRPAEEAMWRVIKKWTKCLNERFDTDAILILDQFQEAFGRTGGPAVLRDLLLTLYQISKDVWTRPLKFKWIIVDVLPFEIRGNENNMDAQWPQRKVPEIPVELFGKEEVKRYILDAPSPPRLALSALKKALQRDDAEAITSRLHDLTGGHPALLNALLCHMKKLYHYDGEDIPVVLNSLWSALLNFAGFEEAVQETARLLWGRYQSDLLARKGSLRGWICEDVKKCKACPLLLKRLRLKCARRRSSSDEALSLQKRGILIDRDQAECAWLSPWIAKAIDEGCR